MPARPPACQPVHAWKRKSVSESVQLMLPSYSGPEKPLFAMSNVRSRGGSVMTDGSEPAACDHMQGGGTAQERLG